MKLTAESTVINDEKLNTDIDEAQTTADTAEAKADTAQATANQAKGVADTTAQYFWFTSSGSDTGAHISEKTQEEFIANPSGGNLLARSNGIAVREGTDELATFTGTQARIGKASSGNVTITETAITMSDGTQVVYEVANNPSGAVKITRIYNADLTEASNTLEDYISLGRSISSWVANGIILTYKVNGGTDQKAYFSTMPIEETTGLKYGIWCYLNGTTVEALFQTGGEATSTDVITIVSLELNFNTTQQVLESTLGAYADKNQSGAFRIGKGTASNAKANAMLVDWAGNGIFSGDVVAYSNANSSGGMSLTKEEWENGFWWESGSTHLGISVSRVGRIVVLGIVGSKDTSTSAGANIFTANLANARIPVPTVSDVTGGSYYGIHAIGFRLYYDESNFRYTLAVRNASSSAVTISDVLNGSLTYICETDPVTHAIRYTNDEEY